MTAIIPTPPCWLGYPRDSVEQILAEDITHFDKWMRGQTVGICDGTRYNHDSQEVESTGCGPHGVVVYAHDLDRYLGTVRISRVTEIIRRVQANHLVTEDDFARHLATVLVLGESHTNTRKDTA